MSGIKYLADTNCFIYLLEENSLLLPFAEDLWAFSFITEMELLSKKGITNYEDTIIRKLLSTCIKINHTQTITDLTIELRRKEGLKLPDAIIAATAKYLNLPLLTADKDFSKIKDIDCLLLDI
jgi:predicted nucleic acid-binding protein